MQQHGKLQCQKFFQLPPYILHLFSKIKYSSICKNHTNRCYQNVKHFQY